MITRCKGRLLIAAWIVLVACGASGQFRNGIVASVAPAATEAGVAVLRDGGNAIDAAVAVALTLGVVDGENSGLGGGCFMLMRLANGKIIAIDGRETAPAAATRDMFLREGKAVAELSQTGALASGVPGALAAYDYAVRHYGKKRLKDLLLPAADLAENGFRVRAAYAATLRRTAPEMAQFESSRAVFFKAAGQPWAQGDTLRQPDLAKSYRQIAAHGVSWFYNGPFSAATAAWMKNNGGLLTQQDFRAYKVETRKPLMTTYREWQIAGFPPPSSGGVHVAEALNILEHFDLRNCDEATRLHLIAEALKLVFADRAYWLGDPAYARVPRGLISKNYASVLAAKINPQHATQVSSHGTPDDWQRDVFKKHTTHFSVADAAGNWVACTATVNTSFGSKVVIPDTGIVMNNQMDDFSVQPGAANFFGLTGAEANAVAPGKRPLSSMSPTIVLKHGKPVIALGAAGGPKIISQVLEELVFMLDAGLSPAQAIEKPRVHHQWLPDEVTVETAMPGPLRQALIARGHKVAVSAGLGVSQIVARSSDGREFIGAADPRAGGTASGW